MKYEWLLIVVFLLCALIMKWFVKVIDKFIRNMIIPEENLEEASEVQTKKITVEDLRRKSSESRVSLSEEEPDRLYDEDAEDVEAGYRTPDRVAAESGLADRVAAERGTAEHAGTESVDAERAADLSADHLAAMADESEAGMPIEEAAGLPTEAAKGLLDKLRQKSNVKHEKQGTTVEIGSALPTQIRISHYEQP